MAFAENVTVPNPAGLVWEREPAPHFYTGDQARAYVDEYVADLAYLAQPPGSASADLYKNWMVQNVEDYSAVPQDQLPFELRTTPPSFMAYIQAFYLWVADQADRKAKDKFEQIKVANSQLKTLNELIALVGEIDARAPDEQGPEKVREAILEAMWKRWNRQSDAKALELALDKNLAAFTVSDEYKEFIRIYQEEGLVQVVPDNHDVRYVIYYSTSGAGVGSVMRNLQAEAGVRGNNLQTMMSEASTDINFQSAVNEGYKSFGDRWFQMLTQSSPRG